MESRNRETKVMSLAETLQAVEERLKTAADSDVRTISTGFPILDGVLGGGLHAGELLLLGGAPGVGKTIMALQFARNVARSGGNAVFALGLPRHGLR
jgi:predicted ATP-dependent serine protease